MDAAAGDGRAGGMTAPTDVAASLSGGSEVRRSARSGAVGLAGAVVSGLFGMVLAVVITRGFGTAGSGAFFTAVGLVTIASAVCALGADTGLIWALPRRRLGADGDAARMLPVALTPPVVVSTVAGLVGFLLAPTLAPVLFDRSGGEAVDLLRLSFAALPFVVAMNVLLSAVRGTRSIGAYSGVQFFLLPISRPVFVGVAALASGAVAAGMFGWLLPAVLAVVACVALAAGPLAVGRGARLRPERDDWRTFWRFALPRAGSAAIDSSSMWVGVLLTAALAGQHDAGVFGAVGRYALAGLLAMQGLRVAVAPQLSRLLGAGRVDEAAQVHRQTTTWIVVLSWPLYLMLAFFAPAFLALFGGGFTAGAGAMAVLAAAMLLKVGLGNVQTLLLMSGHSGRHLLATVVGLATNVVLGFALIPEHGAWGAAIAWGSGIVVENVLAAGAAWAALRQPLVTGGPAAIAAAVLVGMTAVCGLAVLVAGRGVAGLLVAIGLTGLACLAMLASGRIRAQLVGVLRSIRRTA